MVRTPNFQKSPGLGKVAWRGSSPDSCVASRRGKQRMCSYRRTSYGIFSAIPASADYFERQPITRRDCQAVATQTVFITIRCAPSQLSVTGLAAGAMVDPAGYKKLMLS